MILNACYSRCKWRGCVCVCRIPWPVPSSLSSTGEGNSCPSSLWLPLAVCSVSESPSATLNTPCMVSRATQIQASYCEHKWEMWRLKIKWLQYILEVALRGRCNNSIFERENAPSPDSRPLCLSNRTLTSLNPAQLGQIQVLLIRSLFVKHPIGPINKLICSTSTSLEYFRPCGRPWALAWALQYYSTTLALQYHKASENKTNLIRTTG